MKKDYPGKLYESGTIYISEKDPRASQLSNYIINDGVDNWGIERRIRLPIVFDYTSFKPRYESDEWWYFNQDTKKVHVMIEEAMKIRMGELINREKEGSLTEKEKEEWSHYEAVIELYSHEAAKRALEQHADLLYDIQENSVIEAEDKIQHSKKEYRTKSKAEDATDSLPSNLAIITNNQYRESLSLRQSGGNYLLPLASTDGLSYDGNNLYFKGLPASEATLREINKDKNIPIESIDLPLLRMFYSIILADFETNARKFGVVNESVIVYVPDLAVLLGKKRNLSKNDLNSIIEKTASFQTIYGVLKDQKRPNGIGSALPLLTWMGYHEETNTIQFASPYMTELIRRIYNVSIRRDKQGAPKIKKDGSLLLEVSHSYLVKSSIVKERNKRAVEIVMVVVTTIEQAGKKVPHLKARTIVERIPQLQEAYEKATVTNKNRVLSRAFKKAWELLETQTSLRKKYPDIVLPDPNDPQNIPTVTTLDMVFEFPHK